MRPSSEWVFRNAYPKNGQMERQHIQRVHAQGTSLLLRWHGKGYEAMLQICQCHRTCTNGHYITNSQQKNAINKQIPTGPSREDNAVMTSQQMQQIDQNLHYNTDVEPSTSAFQKPMTTT
jgi:hypothetical protein